ncbi:MAG: glycosyltransferase family 4 protein [Actinomycetota bacterium]
MSNDQALVVMVEPQPTMRGPQRTLLELATYAARRSDVLVAVPEGFVSRILRQEASNVRLLPLPFHNSRVASWTQGASALLAALNSERRPVLIHANGLSALNLAAPVARRLDAPVLVHFHAYEILPRSRVYLSLWRWLGVRMRFFPVSEFSRGLLEGTSVRPLVRAVLPNPVDCAASHVERDGPRTPFRVGFVGGRTPRKGLDLLIEIADLLRDEHVEWRVYGISVDRRNSYLDRCRLEIRRRGLERNIRWLGKFEDPRSAYSSMDALLIPSRQESFSRVALEGMASGLPVIATRVTGLSEVISDDVSGLLFDPQRPQEGADHVRRILHDSGLRARLMTVGRRTANRFDLSAVGRTLDGFYRELLASSGPGHTDGH